MEFRQAFDSLSDAGDALQASLARERKSHQKVWTEREQLYLSISDTLIQVDARFKTILERKGRDEEPRPLRQSA